MTFHKDLRIPFILSLHRPLNKTLKTSRWVCEFLKDRNDIKSSDLNLDFYFFLLKKLELLYKDYTPEEYHGIPSKSAISNTTKFYSGIGKSAWRTATSQIIRKSNRNQIEKQVYSTYKAASYFVNMAKDKLNLISRENKLTEHGKKLLNIRSGSHFSLTKNEKLFFFQRILKIDFLIFISLCFFEKMAYKYKLSNIVDYQYAFLEDYYKISHFNFTSPSLENYNTVRLYWLKDLNVLDKYKNIRKSHLEIISKDPHFSRWYLELNTVFSQYERINLKSRQRYLKNKEVFFREYYEAINTKNKDIGFVNLHDLKSCMKMSFKSFEEFINVFYEEEKRNSKIFFSNVVNSVDRRQRFSVNNIPVFKIKIKS